jgi:hypothetical protein
MPRRLLLLTSLLLAACSEPFVLPDTIEIADPDPAIDDLETVEDLSEEVADRLLLLGDEMTRRDFTKLADWFAKDFAGHALAPLAVKQTDALSLGGKLEVLDPAGARIVDRAGFLAGLESVLGAWGRAELALWKVKGAEFDASSGKKSGKIRLYLDFIGDTAEGGREEITGWAWAGVVKKSGKWVVHRFQLESLSRASIERRPFTEVGGAAGVAHLGIRFGKPGNTEDAWNGAAAGDIDGDGLFDIFVPSRPRNFLYRALGDGTFEELAEARGLAGPEGGTGAVFFDFDADGDQDLFVAHRAWKTKGQWEGESLHLYANDGKGSFSDVSAKLGLDVRRYGFSATLLDHDGDGWLDLFVCGYGRPASEHNNSWTQATNGQANSLFRNLEGRGFEDVAPALGMDGRAWSYAAAAADFDRDGDEDLYVANDYGVNQLWRNAGDGSFVDVAEELGVTDIGNGMGVTWGDLNSDGRLDLYVSNMSSTAGSRILTRLADSLDPGAFAQLKKFAGGNTIFLATPEGGFQRQESARGGVNASWAWSTALADLDLDGDIDAYCANGFVTGDQAADT